MSREFRLAALVATALTSAFAAAAPAAADTSAPTWNCRASVVQLFGASPEPRFEPLVAHGDGTTGADRASCADDQAGMPSVDGGAGSFHAQGPFAATDVTPDIAATRDQTATAGSTTADVVLKSPDGAHSLTIRALYSQAKARCVNGAPQLTGASQVVGFAADGQAVPVDDALTTITTNFNDSPFGGIVKVRFNQQIKTATTLTQQAVRVEFFTAAGAPQGTVILGEAKVAQQGDTCAPPADGTSGNGGGTNTVVVTQTQQSTAPASGSANQAGSSNAVRPVVINGRNGGCAHVKMWIAKVTKYGSLKGHPHTGRSTFGTRVVLRGKLISCSGKPVVGARLDQIHAFGGKSLVKTGLKSRAGGKLTLILPMNLASRLITIAYRGDLASRKITSRTNLRLIVRDRKGHTLKRPPAYSLK